MTEAFRVSAFRGEDDRSMPGAALNGTRLEWADQSALGTINRPLQEARPGAKLNRAHGTPTIITHHTIYYTALLNWPAAGQFVV
jgi:hypothetical protein